MLIKCRKVGNGVNLGPTDVLLEINTVDGVDEVIVYQGAVKDGHLEVGKILSVRNGHKLVELPREAASGKWRVWVPVSDVLETA